LRDEPLWDGPGDNKPAGPEKAKPTTSKPDIFARSRETANRLGLQATARNLAGPTAATALGAKPTSVKPAKPGTSSPANATTAQKIKGGLDVYKSQIKSGDIKGAEATGKATWAAANPKLAAKVNSDGTQKGTGQSKMSQQAAELRDMQKASQMRQQGANVTGANITSVRKDVEAANKPEVLNKPAPAGSALAAQQAQQAKPTPSTSPIKKPGAVMSSFEWGTMSTIKDVSNLYSSIYEGKKKDQDQDGDNDFADVRIARMIASGMSRAEAIAAVKNKEYNEEYELDEATRMRKELGKEGEIATRKELAARSKAFKRSGSVDKTIEAAERGAARPYIKHKRDESSEDRKKREENQSRTLRGLASSRRGSVRDKPRVSLRGYAAKVEGSDRDLQSARSSAMSAGTLTPKEKKQLGEEYQIYEIVVSYLLENNFAETLNDANVIIENMSDKWLEEILLEAPGEWFGGLRDKARASRAAQMQSAKPTPKPGPTASSPFAKPASRNDSGRLTTYGAGGGSAAERGGQTRSQVMQQGAKNLENKNRNPGPNFGR